MAAENRLWQSDMELSELLEHAVPDEPPLPADPPAHRDPLTRLRRDGDLEVHVRVTLARTRHDADRRRRADADHQRLSGLHVVDLQVLRGAHDPLEEVELHGDTGEHRG